MLFCACNFYKHIPLFGFFPSQDSLDIQVEELDSDNPIILTVERQRGSAGYVSVEWMATGDHGNTDIHPLTGQVRIIVDLFICK